ncbi:hypothetical protein JTB14_007058 [Gonioctena quinquepunctata]|nr:hypothetical protein JTB14_007058 [Gonioctena quinquepunctata]
MEQYKRHRKVLRTAFSKIGNELEQLLTAERTDLQDIQVHWDLLEDKYGSLQDINKNVFDSLLESDAPEEELGAEMESCDRYMKRFKLLKYKYEQLRGTTGSINEERASIVSRPASNVSGTTDPLKVPEIDEAETFVIRLIQQECFDDGEDYRLNSLCPLGDEIGLIRLRSKISQREDKKDFRFPVVLPSKHFVVIRLIFDTHVRMCHIGTEGLLSNLREKYWILGWAIRSVIKECAICRELSESISTTSI